MNPFIQEYDNNKMLHEGLCVTVLSYEAWLERELLKARAKLHTTPATLVELKKLCDEYDAEHGSYPESEYEGKTIYEFAVERAARLKCR